MPPPNAHAEIITTFANSIRGIVGDILQHCFPSAPSKQEPASVATGSIHMHNCTVSGDLTATLSSPGPRSAVKPELAKTPPGSNTAGQAAKQQTDRRNASPGTPPTDLLSRPTHKPASGTASRSNNGTAATQSEPVTRTLQSRVNTADRSGAASAPAPAPTTCANERISAPTSYAEAARRPAARAESHASAQAAAQLARAQSLTVMAENEAAAGGRSTPSPSSSAHGNTAQHSTRDRPAHIGGAAALMVTQTDSGLSAERLDARTLAAKKCLKLIWDIRSLGRRACDAALSAIDVSGAGLLCFMRVLGFANDGNDSITAQREPMASVIAYTMNKAREMASGGRADFGVLVSRALGTDPTRAEEAYQSFRGINGFLGGDIGEIQLLCNFSYNAKVNAKVYVGDMGRTTVVRDQVIKLRSCTTEAVTPFVTHCLFEGGHYYLIHEVSERNGQASIANLHRVPLASLSEMLARADAALALAADSAVVAPVHGFVSTDLRVDTAAAHPAAGQVHRLAYLEAGSSCMADIATDLTGTRELASPAMRSPAGTTSATQRPPQLARSPAVAAANAVTVPPTTLAAAAAMGTPPSMAAGMAQAPITAASMSLASTANAGAEAQGTADTLARVPATTVGADCSSAANAGTDAPTTATRRPSATATAEGSEATRRPGSQLMGPEHTSISTANILPNGSVRRTSSGLRSSIAARERVPPASAPAAPLPAPASPAAQVAVPAAASSSSAPSNPAVAASGPSAPVPPGPATSMPEAASAPAAGSSMAADALLSASRPDAGSTLEDATATAIAAPTPAAAGPADALPALAVAGSGLHLHADNTAPGAGADATRPVSPAPTLTQQ